MKAHIVTNFPAAFESYFSSSIMRIAQEKNLFEPLFYNLGDFSDQAQNRVDDKPFGGGAGAVLQVEPIYKAIKHIDPEDTMDKFFLGPRGKILEQSDCETLAKDLTDKECIFLCGHYEGVDERVFEIFDFSIYSLGKYVVSSGEIATMVMIDSLVRLLPGVVGNDTSLEEESYSSTLDRKIEYPQYTRPGDFMGHKVPDVLLSGDHEKIKKWREDNLK